jgi:hypothetical protein
MPTYDYERSIAQKDIQLVTTIQVETVPGANFSKAMIFIDETDAAANFVADPGVDTITEVTFEDYAALVKGPMLVWLDAFYALNAVSHIFLVTYNGLSGSAWSSVDLGAQYALYTERAYWKLAYNSAFNMLAQLALATLCETDPLSQYVYGTHDATCLTGVGTEVGQFVAADLDVPVIYHPSVTVNPALVQLAATLAVANLTGVAVGNKTDFLAIAGFSASGTAGANLTAVQAAYCEGLHVSYFTTVGDGSGRIVAEKWVTCITEMLIGALWVKNYIDTVGGIYIAVFLTKDTDSGFKNNDTYQGCLNLLQVQLNLFAKIGRLLNVKIIAPPFAQLPAAAGDVITIPRAWSAVYADNVREVTIYGTLIIQV